MGMFSRDEIKECVLSECKYYKFYNEIKQKLYEEIKFECFKDIIEEKQELTIKLINARTDINILKQKIMKDELKRCLNNDSNT